MIRRTLREWGTLPYGDGDGCIPPEAAARLVAAARAARPSAGGGADVLVHERHGLRAGQVVGIVAADGCVLEILPKIDDLEDGGVRQRLVHMLAVALDLNVSAGAMSEMDWQKDTLLDILIRLFARRLSEALRRGMPRRYVPREEDLPALRGRLDVHRQFTALAAAPNWLACRFDELSTDIPLNQIMKAAVTRLARMTRNPSTRRLLHELSFTYAGISAVPVRALRWDAVILDRTNARWRELLAMARLLLEARYQTTSAGPMGGTALLFPMNTLFEEYVARTLRRALRDSGLEVVSQGGRRHCLIDPEDGAGLFRTRPDIIVRQGGKAMMIIDTKWKRLKPRTSDRKRGISQPDIYQMMAYGHLYQCDNLMLLYPHHGELGDKAGLAGQFQINGGTHLLMPATLDLSGVTAAGEQLQDLVLAAVLSHERGH